MLKSTFYKKGILVIFAILPFFIFSQKSKNSEEGLTLQFHHFVGDKILTLDDSIYTNTFNQGYTVTKFNYYIGKIRLTKSDGKEFLIDDYFFISEDEEKQKSKSILLENIPSGEYTAIDFILGVDSLHNCSGAQSGALDPINAMFWTWNTGYIFMKIEGKSKVSTLPGNTLEYHIGGYKDPSNCIRNISLQFDAPIFISNKSKNEVNIKTDLSEVLKTPSEIDFSKMPAVNNALNATIIADNYADIFSIINPINEK